MKRYGILGVICFFMGIAGWSQTIVEEFYTADGGNSPITLNGGQKCGQRFTATQPFDGIDVNGPTWSVSGEKGMTIRLYTWAGSYAASVAQKPIVVSVLVDLNDNAWFPCYASKTLPAGQYFWEASEPTNSNPDAVDPYQIGCWLWNGSKYTGGEAYFNGKPYAEVAVEWQRLFADGQAGTWNPFPFSTNDQPTLSQSFESGFEFNAVGIASPTWNGFGAGYRMSLYKWDKDFATTVSKPPIGQTTFTNISDNAHDELYLTTNAPAGRYLVVTDQPVRGSGNVGHWGWLDSSYADDNTVTFADGAPMLQSPSLDVFVGYPAAEKVGKDFASRSVSDVATPILDWELR